MTFPRVVATLGTTTDDPAVLRALAEEGMDVARINTAYASRDELARRIDAVRTHTPAVQVLLDLKGPQLRIECTTERTDPATGAKTVVPCRYPVAARDLIYVAFGEGPVRFNHDVEADLAPGDVVLFANGSIRTRVADPAMRGIEARDRAVLLEVEDPGDGRLNPGSSANVPGRRLSAPPLGARDLDAIAVGVARGVEWYALSFARDARDVLALDAALAADPKAGLVPKIEDESGVARLEEIVRAARETGRPLAVMVGRGDLFLELPRERLPAVQRDLVRRCAALGVPSIVATGLLLSLQRGRVPARAEVADVAAAIRDGATSLLLSDETSNGDDPAHAVRTLVAIAREYRPDGGSP